MKTVVSVSDVAVFFFFLSSYFVVALNLIQVASCFLISPTINQHHRHQHQHQHPQSSVLTLSFRPKTPSSSFSSSLSMVRNIDLAEAIIFYGESSLFSNVDDDKLVLLGGVENLLEETSGMSLIIPH